MTKHVCYVTGNRADFCLLESTLHKINSSPDLELSIAATGMHLNADFGYTFDEVNRHGFTVYKVDSSFEDSSRVSMAMSVSEQLKGFTELFSSVKPDIVMVLGDRGEMLAAAIACLYLSIPIVHIHGGELSGTVDDSIRHAISKIAHFHFVATKGSQARLIRFGESHDSIYVTGAPGLDDIVNAELISETELLKFLDIKTDKPLLTVVFHPNVHEDQSAGQQMKNVLAALPKDCFPVILQPNSDAGFQLIKNEIDSYKQHNPECRVFSHLKREHYLGLIAYSTVLIGNSSSGIIESASFNTPTVNIGDRQVARERNKNTLDVGHDVDDIADGIEQALKMSGESFDNVYGEGKAGERITAILAGLKIDESTIKKVSQF